MENNSTSVIKKKLKYIEGMVINRCFCLNKVEIPEILTINEKIVTLDFIVAVSNMTRVMTSA